MQSPNDHRVTYIARVNHRWNVGTLFGLRRADRRSHVYIVGKTGTGKTTLLETMLRQDFVASEGFALFDPHGDLARAVIENFATESADVIYINVPDPHLRWAFNPFAAIPAESRALATAGLVEAFKKVWPDDWGPRLEHLLRNVVFTLLEIPDGGSPIFLRSSQTRPFAINSLMISRTMQSGISGRISTHGTRPRSERS